MAQGIRQRDRMRGRNQQPLYITRKLHSGGQNTRAEAGSIGEDQYTVLYNADIGVPGKLDKRPGIAMIANDTGTRTMALKAYYPTGGTPAIYRVEGVNVRKWTGSGNWSASLGTVTTGLDSTIIQGGESGENEVLFLQNGTDNPQRIQSADTFQDLGSGATSPPKSLINLFFRNRWWILKNGFLYYSDAFSTDYSTAFSASNGFRFSGYGDDKGLISVRDTELIIFMQNAIFSLAPTATPASTDKPQVVLDGYSCVERKTICQVGDDILYLASDGIRSLKRSINDKLQFGVTYPLSYQLMDEFENINWAQSAKFHSVFWDNKYFFFFAQTPATDINRCWIYWPALDDGTGKGWAIVSGITITSTAKFFNSGQELLYGGSTDGKVYQIWTTEDDDGVAISFQVETRQEDFGFPANYKYGGELELVADSAGDYDVSVYAQIDGSGYTELEESPMSLEGTGPVLPIALPFNLSSSSRISKKFHLDSLGRFKRINFKFTINSVTGSDQIRINEYNCTTFLDEYDSEER